MKKNKLFRLLTVALALVFICQFAVPTFAASYYSDSWSDGSSDYYLEAYTSGTQWREAVTIPNTLTQHYYGNTTFCDNYYTISVTEDWSDDFYYHELLDALSGTNYKQNKNEPAFQVYDDCGGIKPGQPTGKYNIQIGVDYQRIGYVVYQESYGTQNQWDSGQVYSPQRFGDLVVGYVYAEP